ncbi:wu:fc21g02 [Clinocottus analis]|uniref:wu:fc21g02 n=1 Tax=Clinocottus analis TaxID=304258 RepID=UPI0035C13682
MMWSIGILLATALSVESYIVHDIHERLEHGRQLKIYLPKSAEKLEFIPANDPGNTFIYWVKSKISTTKGRVSGTGSDRRWYIDKVTFEDQGTYTQKDFWNKELSAVKVAVTRRHNYVKCVAGDSLYIQLEGIDLRDATLFFTGEGANVTLVRDGARVSQDVPDYWDRVQTHSMKIEIRNVNFSDVGHYTLSDRRDRVVSITRMDLTDRREDTDGNPLMALLLLLGIPAGICCCCRKKIFKKKAAAGATFQSSPDVVHPPPSGPVGPSPPYNTPGQPGVAYYHSPDPNMGPSFHPPPATGGPGQWTGPPPASGYNPGYPPQNPTYPPGGPAMYPPAQPPQWNGPPAGHYPIGPAAPMGYGAAPVMYSSPAPAAAGEPVQEVKMGGMDSSPADHLLTPNQQAEAASPAASPPGPPPTTNNLSSSTDAYEFKIDGGKNSTNFL